MKKIFINLFILFTLIQCGTTGELFLYPGVEDRSCYEYPPEPKEFSKEDTKKSKSRHEEVYTVYTEEGNIIREDGTIECRPTI